ncbi:Solute carrier organic anion transporter like protein [Argiope bruennichi]|uniref:Solute carrier organic anion transporter like protein n=1 Tax=Argiope bruennichi TaxID=94029 RepID=A0A8T0FZQ8_ARGBR|nr:Solute carrier organic anion transporter like protein [Argiope bruennichi]
MMKSDLKNDYDLYEILEDEDSQCRGFRVKCKGRFSNPKFYYALSNTVVILEGIYFTYFIGVISTLEKRFEFGSLVSGSIIIADSICEILVSLLLVCFPWKSFTISSSVFSSAVVSMSCFMCTVPYFIYGPAVHLLPQQTRDISGSSYHKTEEQENFVKYVAIIMLFLANFLRGLGNKECFLKTLFHFGDAKGKMFDYSEYILNSSLQKCNYAF